MSKEFGGEIGYLRSGRTEGVIHRNRDTVSGWCPQLYEYLRCQPGKGGGRQSRNTTSITSKEEDSCVLSRPTDSDDYSSDDTTEGRVGRR